MWSLPRKPSTWLTNITVTSFEIKRNGPRWSAISLPVGEITNSENMLLELMQSSFVIIRDNIILCYINHDNDDCREMSRCCTHINTLKSRQHGRYFADDTFKRIFLNENVIISIKISMKFIPKSPINNIPAMVQIMAWRRSGGKPLSEPMMVNLLTNMCVTRPQWVKHRISHHLGRAMWLLL